jgi:hypothetical protein
LQPCKYFFTNAISKNYDIIYSLCGVWPPRLRMLVGSRLICHGQSMSFLYPRLMIPV